MASNKKKSTDKNEIKVNKKILNALNFIQQSTDDMYQSTYNSPITVAKDIDTIKNDIDNSIDNIMSSSSNSFDISNISKLYTRMKVKDKQNDGKVVEDISKLFNDQTLMDSVLSTYTQNKYLRELDKEIDVICKYMPRLDEALDLKKDNVLSADHFSKEFINVTNTTSKAKEATFNKRIEELKRVYKLDELIETSYEKAAKYGEQFIYIVPYNQAISRLLSNKSGLGRGSVPVFESAIFENNDEEITILENGKLNNRFERSSTGDYSNLYSNKYGDANLKVSLDRRGILASAVENINKVNKIVTECKYKSVYESFINEQALTEAEKFELSKSVSDNLEYPKELDYKSAADGLTAATNDEGKYKINIPGCVVSKLPRENIIPIYIDDLCMGYYYLEFNNDNFYNFSNMNQDPAMLMKATTRSFLDGTDNTNDDMLKYISGQLSTYMDTNFINANQDLRKEIYMILKHNDLCNEVGRSSKIKITFIPPEDMIHIKFKTDPDTHRGISDLARALIPAKLYSALYITNTLGILTRGRDKRIYYVKQNIETNISRTLLNVINQIKKSNFGMRQIENINNVLNISGAYNDMVIPQSASGDPPIQFEILPGQDIDPKTDLMNALEEMSINTTDVSLDMLQTRNTVDYAVQVTMSNSKILRKTFKRQFQYEGYCSQILTRIYNCEYEENERLDVDLPAPAFLNMTNTNQLIENTRTYIQSLIDTELADEDDAVKVIFMRKMLRHYLPSHINVNLIDKVKEASKLEAAVNKQNNGQPNDDTSSMG